jgi:peptidoglycan/xylan/chitin deacetylase (PgdA/CDA1 family)
MGRKLLRLVYILALYSGVVRLLYFLGRRRDLVITYHNVLPDDLFDAALHLGVSHSESAFARQIEIIAKRWPQGGKRKGGSCAISLDDGYRNQYEIVAPILEHHGVTGRFFLTVDLIRTGEVLWPDRLMMWVSYAPEGTYRLLNEMVTLSGADTRRSCWVRLWQHIENDYAAVGRIAADMEAECPFSALPIGTRMRDLRFAAMTAADVRELWNRGHAVAAHSSRHDILANLSDRALAEDFTRCRAELRALFNSDDYSYPFGGSAEVGIRVMQACRAAGFRHGFMNIEDPEADEELRDFAIPRMTLPNTTDRHLIEAKLCGLDRLLRTAYERVTSS